MPRRLRRLLKNSVRQLRRSISIRQITKRFSGVSSIISPSRALPITRMMPITTETNSPTTLATTDRRLRWSRAGHLRPATSRSSRSEPSPSRVANPLGPDSGLQPQRDLRLATLKRFGPAGANPPQANEEKYNSLTHNAFCQGTGFRCPNGVSSKTLNFDLPAQDASGIQCTIR